MARKTLNDRLIESIKNETNDFHDTDLDRTKLLEISNRLVEYVLEVERNETRVDNAARSLENDLYNFFS